MFYATYFVFVGVYLPFWPVWLRSHGLGAADISVLMAVSIAAKLIGNPLCAHFADRSGERRKPMAILAVLALVSFTLFAGSRTFGSILLVSLLFFTLWPPIMALGESLTMLSVRANALDYGRIRLWGSVSFIVAAVASGQVLEGRSADSVLAMLLAALFLVVMATLLLPEARPEKSTTIGRAPVLQVLRRPVFALFLVAATAVQGSHGMYYAFGTIHWRDAGYSDGIIGVLWAEGVVAEIVLFALGARVMRRIEPARLLALGGLAGAVRWTVTGMTESLPLLLVVQTLHAFTFGAAHLGAIHFVSRAVPAGLSATAQSLYAAVVMGLGLGLALLASGPLYAAHGGEAFLAMAVLALVGALLARLLPGGGLGGPAAA